jgi:hypothetical protein
LSWLYPFQILYHKRADATAVSNALAPVRFCASLSQRKTEHFQYYARTYGHSMTPNFALSLSLDGIALLQQVPDGWNLVGEVPLDVPDLHAALTELRDKALLLDPSGLRTKLVIPPDQIRYMSLDTDQTSDADVRRALDGTTPYALDELVIDAVRADGKTHVAAVAQETLDEAAAFAIEHQFNPVACVAMPEQGTVTAEVFFGPLPAGTGLGITRAPAPALQTGVARMPMPKPEPKIEFEDMAVAAEVLPPVPQTPTVDAADDKASADQDAPVFASRSKVAPPTINPVRLPASSAQVSAGAVVGDGDTTTTSPSPRILPQTPGTAPTVPAAVAAGNVLTATPLAPPKQEPLFTHRKEPPAPATGNGRTASATVLRAAMHSEAAAMQPVDNVSAMPAWTQGAAAEQPTAQTAAKARPRGKPRFLGLILTGILLLVLLLVGLWASTLPVGTVSGWFRGADVDATPQIAATSTETAADDVVADAAEPVAAQQETDVDIAIAAPSNPPEVETAQAPSAIVPQDMTAVTPPAPIVRAPIGRVLSPDEADRLYAATGVYQRAPRIATTPSSTPLEGVDPVAVVDAPEALSLPGMPAQDAAVPDAVIAEQPVPPAADVVFARDARGNIAATPNGIITPQGAVVIAGAPDVRPVLRPGTPRVATAPVDPVMRPANLAIEAAVEAPESPDAAPDGSAFVVGPPPLRPVLRPGDAAELEVPAVDVTEAAPLPVSVPYTGVRPRLRPGGLIATAATPTAADDIIAAYTGSRPVLRPSGLAPAPAAIEKAVAEAAALEPIVTADINAVAAAIAAAAPVSSFSNRTALAVSVARRPDTRPRNFSQVVASARQATAPPPAPAAAAPTRTAAVAATPAPPTIVAPSGNVPGGVAQAATVDGAINLRQMNLVGVYGKPNARRALVRLGNGRYVKVEVGSALDGGQVTAIGDTALNFVKRGKTYALTLPG